LLTTPKDVEALVEGLEVRYLANRGENLYFALLTDLPDAPAETMPGDEELLRIAREGIDALNRKYRHDNGTIFFLLHRPRRWNPRDRVWMGYERKRGKLADLNLLLRDPAHAGFSLVVGPAEVLSSVRYVITLDTDTQLPRDA